MLLYACTIFTSAFLLFLVQPIMAKQILPWFGGSAAVWTTCLVFFQFVLLFGYAYSDWTTRNLKPRNQSLLHVALLVASLVFLPIVPGASWKPQAAGDPALQILGLLMATIGLPYFLLSTTGPLVQAWYVRRYQGAVPYRLFALSNLASLLALLSFPVAIETNVGTRLQALSWSTGYGLFVLLCSAAALITMRYAGAAPAAAAADDGEAVPPTSKQRLLWCTLAAMGSFLLLAITNHLCQNIAAIPFLWLLPLTLYLITFILCFDGRGWYRRELFVGLMALSILAMAYVIKYYESTLDLRISIPVFSLGLFFCCMFCHGELTLVKPAPRYLTQFYLMISLGGAIGAMLVGVIAPRVLPAFFEMQGGLILCGILALIQMRKSPIWATSLGVLALGFSAWCVGKEMYDFASRTMVMERDFYGVLRVWETLEDKPVNVQRRLYHGTILHGSELVAESRRREPTTYYGKTSGVGRSILTLGDRGGIRVGVIGLGAGSLAAYSKAGDVYRFYEIDPPVITLARNKFFYISGSQAKIDTVLGDARLNLEREPSNQFDLLAVDAFSGDSIPVHLITTEAVGVYLRHLKPGGVMAFHVSNHFLDLGPVVQKLAESHGKKAVMIADEPQDDPEDLLAASDWVLVSDNQAFFDMPRIRPASSPIPQRKEWALWTDDFNNLFQILK